MVQHTTFSNSNVIIDGQYLSVHFDVELKVCLLRLSIGDLDDFSSFSGWWGKIKVGGAKINVGGAPAPPTV